MKLLYTLVLLVCAHMADAQDFCKLVKKEVSDNKKQFDYASPYANDHIPAIRVKRSISLDEEFPYDNFTFIFRTYCGLDDIYDKTADGGQKEKLEKMLVVEFDDNTKIINDSTDISHDFTDDRTEAIRDLYFQVDEATANAFANKKVVRYSLAGQMRTVPADSANAVMQFTKCIKAAK